MFISLIKTIKNLKQFIKNAVNISRILELIKRDALNSDIWEMYGSDRYFASFKYKYDSTSTNNYIEDGGQDMYDGGNKVSTKILLV